jgi:hypothetical protein
MSLAIPAVAATREPHEVIEANQNVATNTIEIQAHILNQSSRDHSADWRY